MTKAEATQHFGSQAALARALNITKASVGAWDEIPFDRQCQIQVITGGKLLADGQTAICVCACGAVVGTGREQEAA